MSQSKTIAEPASPGLVAEGFRWLWNHELLRPMAIVLGLLNGLGMLSGAILVLFAQQVLSTSATEFALLGTGGAIGGVIGGLVVTIADRYGSRELALRLPWFVAAAGHPLLFVFAAPRLTTAKIERARAAALSLARLGSADASGHCQRDHHRIRGVRRRRAAAARDGTGRSAHRLDR